MEAGTPRFRRGLKLTQRLALALTVGAVFIALVLGFLHASSSERESAERQAQAEAELTTALSERAAPLLERGDLMRLSVLATVARDQVQGRVLVLDRGGRVVLDTALVLGDRQLGLLAGSGPFQRTTVRESTADEPRVVQRETLAPIRFGGDVIGEFRMQREVVARKATFDFAWFGLVLLSCLSLVVVAVVMGHHWSMRIRRATDSLIRLSAGEAGDVETGSADSEMRELGDALREMERGLNDGLSLVAAGYIGMAQQLVDNLERHRLVPPGHGVRSGRLAARVADRLQLVAEDRADLELACRFVDLGKGWVRPAILQKQGALTANERDSLRQHPMRAADALESMPALRRVARIVRHQGERYDGAGRPDGLRGDGIPLGARIVAIASSFDLLTTCAAERPMPWEQALGQLEKARGEVFDPWLLDVFDEEIRRDPPVTIGDRPVMIVPGGTVPWGEIPDGIDDDLEDDALTDELEVLADEDDGEETA